MRLLIQSDGIPSRTRVLVVPDDGPAIDVSAIVVAVTWHCHCADAHATATVEFDAAAVDASGELTTRLTDSA